MEFNNKINDNEDLLKVLQERFIKNMYRHPNIAWDEVVGKLQANPTKLQSISMMEESGGEPDIITNPNNNTEYLFCDCSLESPKGRRSLCYDDAALESRKENKPQGSAIQLANQMGIEILDEEQYKYLMTFGEFDTKTSSWVKTPDQVRVRGGAIFGDFRFGRVFIYHNGAESYYAARGFRGIIYL